jgi:rhamnosyltransferase
VTQSLVSIIIRVKNEERWISACLRSVFSQSYENIEVIIVDNESTDKTLFKAEEFPVKIVSIKEYFPGKAINEGIKKSKGDYIVCLSGHCIPVSDDWLSNLVKDLHISNIAGIYGRQEPLSFSSDLDKRDLITVFGLDKKIQVKDSFFHNANSAFRRDVWEEYPFDEVLTNIEDRVWGEKVIQDGYNLVYEPNASVYHWHGIHQDLNSHRAKNIVKILESLDTFKRKKSSQDPNNLSVLAIIPIKGVSKNLNGSPLLKKTILSANKSKFINDVVIAIDSKKTEKIAKDIGNNRVIMRPKALSEDYVDVFDVAAYVIDTLSKEKKQYDIVVLLEEIYPFRSDGIIDDVINQLVSSENDTVIAGQKEMRSIWKIPFNENNLDVNNIPMPSSLKSYDSAIGLLGLCCATSTSCIKSNSVFSGKTGIYNINDPISRIVVRDEDELRIAEIIDNSLNA